MENDILYCRRCGKKLKTEQSKKLGYGKTCYKKMMEESSKKLFDAGITLIDDLGGVIREKDI